MPPKYKGFCFTYNNYTVDDEKMLMKLFERKHYFRFLAYGKEVAPSTGTPHLQGFFYLNEPAQFAHVKRKISGAWVGLLGADKGPHYHLEDDGKTGFGYCFKEHQPGWIMVGVPPTEEEFKEQAPKGQGARSDLLAVKKKIDEGVTCEALQESDEHFGTFAAHSKFFQGYQSAKRRRTTFSPPEVHVIFGPTGTNKSRRVWDSIKDADGNYDTSEFFKLSPDMAGGATVWWDGYCGQKIVLIEEFRPGHMKFNTLLDITDGYPTKVQVKGTSVHWSPEKIFITSPVSPYEWYPNLTAQDKLDQLLRRITSITDTSR